MMFSLSATTERHIRNSTNTAVTNFTETTELSQLKHNEKADLVWIVTLPGTTAVLFIAICLFSLRYVLSKYLLTMIFDEP